MSDKSFCRATAEARLDMIRPAQLLCVIQVALLVILGLKGKVALTTPLGPPSTTWSLLADVQLMMFVGFGYLMTFLRRFGTSAVGFTLLLTALVMQLHIFAFQPFFVQLHTGTLGSDIIVSLEGMLDANFAAAAVLISFGAVIGRASLLQLLIMASGELIFYNLGNEVLLASLGVADCGGTIAIHMFGAYFGLAVSWMIGVPLSNPDESASYTSDITSLLGTVFLWIYWPSFVAGSLPADTDGHARAILFTIVALCGSTVATFMCAIFLNSTSGKLKPVIVQNATLAGGVAIGCTANVAMNPATALGIGVLAGIVSSFGYAHIQPTFLTCRMKLHDTCGVHNLHGIPSILGGLASAIIAAVVAASDANADIYPHGNRQWTRQLAGVGVTLVLSIVSGLLTGKLMWLMEPYGASLDEDRLPSLPHAPFAFDDRRYWDADAARDEPDEDAYHRI